MIVNPEKFQAIKQKHDYSNETIKFDIKTVETVFSAKLLGIRLYDKLNFILQVSIICKSTANQLSALIKLNNFLCFEGKRVLINSYYSMSNLNYCPRYGCFLMLHLLRKSRTYKKEH